MPLDPNLRLDIATAPRTDSKRWQAGSITWRALVARLSTPEDHKDCGGYVLGRLLGEARRKTTIIDRNTVTLDADSNPDLQDICEKLDVLGYAAVVHSTYGSAPDGLRLRILIPLSRRVAPDEYHAIASGLLDTLGRDAFDPSTVQPERFMYWSSAQNPEWFIFHELAGDPLDVDEALRDWEPDLSELPAPTTRKRNPLELEGVMGAFNRAFDFDAAIAEFSLPYVQVSKGRWQLVGARAIAGLNLIADGLVFSHHVTDPAHGRTCSAFDLVRIHRYGHLDEDVDQTSTPINRLPSHLAMEEEMRRHPRIMGELLGDDFSDLEEGIGWHAELDLDRQGRLKPTVQNWDLLRDNDPALKVVFYNEMTLTVEASGDLPWRAVEPGRETFTSVDTAELAQHIERTYRMAAPSRSRVDEAVQTAAHRRRRNPVAEWLNGLKWDGVERVETSLPGVRPTQYARTIARKCLVAAVARMLDPGCKWDHTLILFGDEGLGKTFWIQSMSRGYSASLGNIGDKDTLIAMQRSWIMVSDEGHSLAKADVDAQKEFLTRTEDVFRMPYDREAVPHPRHCVIWGSTNDKIFLRRMEGNRRFLIVHCEKKVDFGLLTDEYINQVWAEAVHLYREGEQLFLSDDQSIMAREARDEFTEEDTMSGIIQNYLDTPVPLDWDSKSPDARAMWIDDEANGFEKGDVLQNRVCSIQLWVEALHRRKGEHRRVDLLEISKVMHGLPGWRALPGRHRMTHYGPQMVFERIDQTAQDLAELL